MNAKPVIGDFIACALRLLLSVLLVSTCMSGTTFGLSLVGGARILAETSKGPSGGKTRVVMIGGSFAGLTAARILEKHHSKLEVVVVEPKPFFEYTPGILRAFVQPDLVSRLMVSEIFVGSDQHLSNSIL